MLIHGLQKLTLLDYPGHTACTVFLGGCDLRCPFCHNYELVESLPEPVTDEDAFFDFLRKRKGLLDGVAVTGGEPCLRADLRTFLARIRAEGFLIKLDTNGFHPENLRGILAEHLADYVAMDVKNSPAKYARTTGLPEVDLGPVRESIALIRDLAPDHEFRTTVIREFHEEDDFHEIGKMIRGAKRCFLQAFTDRETVPTAGLHAPTVEEMKNYAEILRGYVPETHLRGIDGADDF